MVDVSTLSELNDIRNDLSEDYVLVNDIDASDTQNWNEEDQYSIEYTGFSFGGDAGEYHMFYPLSSVDAVTDLSDDSSLSYSINDASEGTVQLEEDADGDVLFEFTTDQLYAQGWNPVGGFDNPFTGDFDGNGYEVTNLHVDRRTEYYCGLFRNLDNLITDTTISQSYIRGIGTIGGIVGWHEGNMSDCSFSGEVRGISFVGGVVGYVPSTGDSEIIRCKSDVTINGGEIAVGLNHRSFGGIAGVFDGETMDQCYAVVDIDVSASGRVGGIVGNTFDPVNDCFATGSITVESSATDIGGGVGRTEGTITTSYAAVSITGGDDDIGGFVGHNQGTITDCYWDEDVSGISSGDGTPLSTSEMQGSSAESNMNFDWVNTWNTISDDYPLQMAFGREIVQVINQMIKMGGE